MTTHPRVSCLVLLCAMLLTTGAASAPAEEMPIRGAGPPTLGPVDVPLDHAWTVGGGDLLIGEVAEIVVDGEGTVFVLDAQLGEVQVLSPDGNWLRSIGREGEGPGEFRHPTDVFLTHDGNVAVVQQMPSKVALLSKDGLALDDQVLPDVNDGYRLLLLGAATRQGMVLTRAQFLPRDDGSLGTTIFLEAITSAGESIGEMYRTDGGIDFENMTLQERDLDNVTLYWAVTSDDRVAAVTSYDAYRIDVREIDGAPVHSIRRDVPPRLRTQAEKDAVSERFDMSINGREVEIIPEENARVVDGLVARERGGLWALLRESPEIERQAGRVMRIDEFDAKGNYVRQLVLRGDADPALREMYVRGDRLYVVSSPEPGDDMTEITLSCYTLDLPLRAGHPDPAARDSR